MCLCATDLSSLILIYFLSKYVTKCKIFYKKNFFLGEVFLSESVACSVAGEAIHLSMIFSLSAVPPLFLRGQCAPPPPSRPFIHIQLPFFPLGTLSLYLLFSRIESIRPNFFSFFFLLLTLTSAAMTRDFLLFPLFFEKERRRFILFFTRSDKIHYKWVDKKNCME